MKSVIALSVVITGLTLGACDRPREKHSNPAAQGQGLPVPEHGVQYKMHGLVEPFTETEQCQFIVAPPDGLNITRSESRYTPGSHHMLLFRTNYVGIPTVNRRGETVDTSGVFDCSDGATADWEVSSVVAGAQTPETEFIQLPPGVAMVVKPNEVLLMNVHYLNASEEPLHTDIELNLHTIDATDVTQQAGVVFWYNAFIHIPPHSESTARMICPITHDVTLVNAQSHMHRRGISYEASLLDANFQPLEQMYTESRWEDPHIKTWTPGFTLRAGQHIDFRCGYLNSTDAPINQGPTTRDEMCMFIGLYYPYHEEVDYCGTREAPASYGIHIGDGDKTCAQSMECISAAKPFEEDGGVSMFPCITQSCPGAAFPLADYLGCAMSESDPQACQAKYETCAVTSCTP